MSRTAVLGLAIGLSLGLPACAGTRDARHKTPAQALITAAGVLGMESVVVTKTSPSGREVIAVDVSARRAWSSSVTTFGTPVATESVLVDGEVFTRSGPVGAPGQWLHVAARRIEPGGRLDLLPAVDPFGTDLLTNGLTSAERTGDRAYAGKLDIAAAPGISAAAGTGKAEVPFTARVDEHGRLVELIVGTPGPDGTTRRVQLTYSDFGKVVTAERPAGTIDEAPAGLPGTVRS